MMNASSHPLIEEPDVLECVSNGVAHGQEEVSSMAEPDVLECLSNGVAHDQEEVSSMAEPDVLECLSNGVAHGQEEVSAMADPEEQETKQENWLTEEEMLRRRCMSVEKLLFLLTHFSCI